ncbi:helix-turn-helix domain-containing protein [Demequina silvatica]|uniref:helix-turn-helix domain-containing protein n=1 Tax=Demequina silvatica TaxID=1638988 RepID=UPI000783F0B6|nr:helix-turn-helix domain-containing protein [Demequina silvatica]
MDAASTGETYLTTEELAAKFRTNIDTVRYWRHRGIGPRATKIGRRVLYAASDVARWADERREAVAS